jgi:hypothetical protein
MTGRDDEPDPDPSPVRSGKPIACPGDRVPVWPGRVDGPALEAVTPFPPAAPSSDGADPGLDMLGDRRDHKAAVPDVPAAVARRFDSGRCPPAVGSLDGGALGGDLVPRRGPVRQAQLVVSGAPEVDADQVPGLGTGRRTGRGGCVPEGTPPTLDAASGPPVGDQRAIRCTDRAVVGAQPDARGLGRRAEVGRLRRGVRREHGRDPAGRGEGPEGVHVEGGIPEDPGEAAAGAGVAPLGLDQQIGVGDAVGAVGRMQGAAHDQGMGDLPRDGVGHCQHHGVIPEIVPIPVAVPAEERVGIAEAPEAATPLGGTGTDLPPEGMGAAFDGRAVYGQIPGARDDAGAALTKNVDVPTLVVQTRGLRVALATWRTGTGATGIVRAGQGIRTG